MKKWLLVLATCLIALPGFSLPPGKLIPLLKVKPSVTAELVNSTAVEGAVQKALARSAVNLPIVNLPTRPVVQFHFKGLPAPASLKPVRLLPQTKLFATLFVGTPKSGFGDKQVFVPGGLIGPAKALYRGIKLADIEEVKNLLMNGLETRKVRMQSREIFTSFDPVHALLYAIPGSTDKAMLPVLIKIPFSPMLQEHISSQYPTATAFKWNIPAGLISDVWVLLDINGRPNWCKAVMQEGELVLLPGQGELHSQAELTQP